MKRLAQFTITFLLLVSLFIPFGTGNVQEAAADNPLPAQIFYITLPETDALTVLNTINTDAVSPMTGYFTIAVGVTGTWFYYDNWENGYITDLANPTAAEIYNVDTNPDGVRIGGNGNCADGWPPNKNGTPITRAICEANPTTVDHFIAGDVVIVTNQVPVPRVVTPNSNVVDAFGTVSYSNNDGNVNWNGSWIETGDSVLPTGNFRDTFATQSYSRNDGSLNWTGNWIEENDDGSPTAGTIYINTTAGALRFRQNSVANDAIYRQANTSAYTGATLTFTLDGNNIGTGDAIKVQVSGNGGSTWTDLQTFNTDPNGATQTFDISGYIATNTRVRFIMVDTLETGFGDGNNWNIDNVDITVTGTPTPDNTPSAGDMQIIGGALRFTETEANDSIDRGVNLSVGGDCATLAFTLGQSGIDANEDRFAVQVSADGGTNYTTVATYTSSADAGTKSIDISAYASALTRVRFISLDQLEAGEYWTVDNVRVDWDCYLPILFDGRDKLGATATVAVARAVWASGSGTLNAFGHEVYDTNDWGTEYIAPVGTNTANAGQMFEYSGLSIMASANNTLVDVDVNGDGDLDPGDINDYALNEGGSFLVPGISEGARVVATNPVQTLLVTGDIGSNYASRDMNLLPTKHFDSSYWSPVGTTNTASYPTRLFIHNPRSLNTGQIYVTCERYGVPATTLGPVALGATTTIDLTNGQGAKCYASTSGGVETTDKIEMVGTIDTPNTAFDWSFTAYPDNFLTAEGLVGMGMGMDPTYTGTADNGSPIWITAGCTGGTWVYVDWNNDGTADPVDTDGGLVAEANSENGIYVNYLQSVRLYDPSTTDNPYDQTGARIWSRTAQNMGDYDNPLAVLGCKVAMAWGEDPANIAAGAPGLDVGTSIPPFRLMENTKKITFVEPDGDILPTGVLNSGDTVYYTIRTANVGPDEVTGIHVYDTVPPYTDYVPDSTQYAETASGPWYSIPDSPGETGDALLPLDDGLGWLIWSEQLPVDDNGILVSGDEIFVRFQVTINMLVVNPILNCETTISEEAGDFYRCVARDVADKDWGDLPDSYGTSAASNGPRHTHSGLYLGTLWDIEVQGAPTANAVGDNLASWDDEDGVVKLNTGLQWFNGNGAFGVTVTGGSGYLNAWMYINRDGDFNDTVSGIPERLLTDYPVVAGSNTIPVTIPAGLNGGTYTSYYFRFRLTPAEVATPSPLGLLTGGEVEDYLFDIGHPTAVDLLSFTAVPQDGGVLVGWESVSEFDNMGYNLYRAEAADGEKTMLNTEMIPTGVDLGSPTGAVYSFTDMDVVPGLTYYYWLEDIDATGTANLTGPVEVLVP